MPHVIAGVRIPDDDEMWSLYRHTSNRQLAEELGVDHSGLTRHLRARGWIRARRTWRLQDAPCRECGTGFHVARTIYRLCPECLADPRVARGPEGASLPTPKPKPEPEPMEGPMFPHITDDQLWERRNVSVPEQARWFGVPEWELRAELRDRGWRRSKGGVLETAPCADCPGLVEITPTTTERLCASCLAGETPIPPLTDALIADHAALLRRERMRVRRKRARIGEREWADRYARPGGPEMGGRRRAAA